MHLPATLTPESLAAWRQVQHVVRISELLSQARGLSNDFLLATVIASQSIGRGVLPADFGLGPNRLTLLFNRHFPGLQCHLPKDFRAQEPLPEHLDLVSLLLRYRANIEESEYDIAVIVATACRGNDHLWQDLGLNNRRELSELFIRNFPKLAALNDRDMKWKKFLYKRLCEEDGIYVCRAPSCSECKDLPNCFGPEE